MRATKRAIQVSVACWNGILPFITKNSPYSVSQFMTPIGHKLLAMGVKGKHAF